MIKSVNHIGIAVRDLNKAIGFYKKLGLEVEGIEIFESQKVRVAFIPVGDVRIELLEATSDESAIAKFIEKKGEGIHHIALDTENLTSALTRSESEGIHLIDRTPRSGAHNTRIAFLHPKSTNGVLLELCEKQKK